MAEVMRARPVTRPGRTPADQPHTLAIKHILPAMAEDQRFVTMFMDEARIAAQLDHPNIIKLVDMGQANDGHFLVMEYVDGIDLRTLFQRCCGTSTRIPLGLACHVVARVCDALSYANSARDGKGRIMHVVHRDVSPANILIGRSGEIKLIDFGVAKANDRLANTQTGMLKGKVSYVSPELIGGKPADHRADVFAAGAVLWELLTGQRLFDAATDFAVLALVKACRPAAVSSHNSMVSSELDAVVARALAKSPRHRYQDAGEMRDALDAIVRASGQAWTDADIANWIRLTEQEATSVTENHRKRDLAPPPPMPPPPRPAVSQARPAGAAAPALPGLPPRAPAPAPAREMGVVTGEFQRRVRVTFASNPPGANVFHVTAGKRRKLGTTPVSVELPVQAACEVSIRKSGYHTWHETVDLTASGARAVHARLRLRTGRPREPRRTTSFGTPVPAERERQAATPHEPAFARAASMPSGNSTGITVAPPAHFVARRAPATGTQPVAHRRSRVGPLLLLFVLALAASALAAPELWMPLRAL